ncbi:MAG TPA: Trm112 family protein [Candidatus Nitrosopelagicus sp.]|jgi:uncharacterized protein YbaR (Trm112 family)|nr:Trm112 family protein [Candidatus Nitrosopelagicus sp.]HJN19526.1 Trm112 family protein [Candidatus Nitrosopelagicus sp.]|tara:strand:+ start:4283 stop:4552 length:270 start_codon:yes stop_codon:yes gene_type:complete
MNREILEILACPIDKFHPLDLFECKTENEKIVEGVLYCKKCSRFFPIIDEIPIMLPDDLRDKKRDLEFLQACIEQLPQKIVKEALPWHL